MKEIIKSVLDKYKDSQLNMGSESARDNLALEIELVLIKELEKDK
tara:strand:+ start:516 stop:650 length:135 start_codon:yes stop_codon:yes gene_type:complete